MKKTIVISVGGSVVVPAKGDGVAALKNLRALLFEFCKKGYKFILVVGGGVTCREYRDRLIKLGVKERDDLDWMGIFATHLNAKYIARALQPVADKEIIIDRNTKKKFLKKIMIAGGDKPGSSTDHMAVLLAKKFGADFVVNLSDVDYIYSADPRKNPNAKKFTSLSWDQMQKIVGTKWSPGMHSPFDPVATALARKKDVDVAMVSGAKLGELKKLLNGGDFKGTWVSNK